MSLLLDFLRSRFGIVSLALALVLLVSLIFHSCSAPPEVSPLPPRTNATEVTRLERNVGSIPVPRPTSVPRTNAPNRSVILSIDVPLPPETNFVPTVFAPAGSQLVCELVNTLESIRIETPVIGVVVRDLVFAEKVIVPMGTRVYGRAQMDRVRDRLSANGTWILVFPNGEELIVEALALHRDEIVPGQHWGPDDGSPGFKGRTIKSSSFDEIKLFAATFLSGISQGMEETEPSVFGSRSRRSVKNAALAGSSAVLDEYARSIAETIKRDGVFVRVDSAAQFYLFLPRFLDRAAARIGATSHHQSKP